MIKTDFTTVKVALGAPAKSAVILLLRNGSTKTKDGWGEVYLPLRLTRHTKHSTLVLPTIALSFYACIIKKLLY